MNIAQNLDAIKAQLLPKVELVAVSKTKSSSLIQEAYDAGQRIFGENRPQEMQAKAAELAQDIKWHMIGHLQSNKVKYIAPFVALIHAVDKPSLLKEINKRALQNDRTIDVLLQLHIAKEENKFGMDQEEVKELLTSDAFQSFHNVRVVGVMGMATNTKDQNIIREEFRSLKAFQQELKALFFAADEHFKEVSMGMSGDFKLAMEEGSTMVRVGSAIFGSRNT